MNLFDALARCDAAVLLALASLAGAFLLAIIALMRRSGRRGRR